MIASVTPVKKIKVDALQLLCGRCGYGWVAIRPDPPKRCPGCHSPLWNTPRVRNRVKVAKPSKKT